MSYPRNIINGIRFHTKEREKSTQNSGVSIEAETICRSSGKDNNQVLEKITYYGIINAIILLDYHTFRVPLFKCDWTNITNGIKIEDGFTIVNLQKGQKQFEKDPFIFASQAKQVFYSRIDDRSSYYIVLKALSRRSYDVEMYKDSDFTSYTTLDASVLNLPYNTNEDIQHVRKDCEDIFV